MLNHKKVTKLKNYSMDNTLEKIRNHKRKKKIRRRLTVVVTVGLVAIVLAMIPILRNVHLASNFDAEAVELTEELASVEKEKKRLDYQVSLLEDEEYIAKLARKELNLSKGNELLINLPEAEEESDLLEKEE